MLGKRFVRSALAFDEQYAQRVVDDGENDDVDGDEWSNDLRDAAAFKLVGLDIWMAAYGGSEFFHAGSSLQI